MFTGYASTIYLLCIAHLLQTASVALEAEEVGPALTFADVAKADAPTSNEDDDDDELSGL